MLGGRGGAGRYAGPGRPPPKPPPGRWPSASSAQVPRVNRPADRFTRNFFIVISFAGWALACPLLRSGSLLALSANHYGRPAQRDAGAHFFFGRAATPRTSLVPCSADHRPGALRARAGPRPAAMKAASFGLATPWGPLPATRGS